MDPIYSLRGVCEANVRSSHRLIKAFEVLRTLGIVDLDSALIKLLPGYTPGGWRGKAGVECLRRAGTGSGGRERVGR